MLNTIKHANAIAFTFAYAFAVGAGLFVLAYNQYPAVKVAAVVVILAAVAGFVGMLMANFEIYPSIEDGLTVEEEYIEEDDDYED